jgi:hypothetical protein
MPRRCDGRCQSKKESSQQRDAEGEQQYSLIRRGAHRDIGTASADEGDQCARRGESSPQSQQPTREGQQKRSPFLHLSPLQPAASLNLSEAAMCLETGPPFRSVESGRPESRPVMGRPRTGGLPKLKSGDCLRRKDPKARLSNCATNPFSLRRFRR